MSSTAAVCPSGLETARATACVSDGCEDAAERGQDQDDEIGGVESVQESGPADAGGDGSSVATAGIVVSTPPCDRRARAPPRWRTAWHRETTGRRRGGAAVADPFGRKEPRRSHHHPGLGERRVALGGGHTEIGQHGAVARAEQHVARPDVAVQHPRRVCCRQRIEQLPAHRRGALGGNGPLAATTWSRNGPGRVP